MKSLGVRFKSEPVRITAGRNKGGWTVYSPDPERITLEIVQPVRDSTQTEAPDNK
ncbi:MAG: hypothetical protein KatS3mg024_1166 [Armatimonadota bacterium]|nr:MAG: hypothetical protein KatS3mg024_1166 [Armatimonadota bacterium]